jgi:hypothetical protein
MVEQMFRIIGIEYRHRPIMIFPVTGAKSPPHQDIEPVTDESPDCFGSMQCTSKRLQSVIYGGNKIISRPDEGSIEIEYEQIDWFH